MTPVVPMQRSGTVVDARMSLAMWLRGGRSQRNMSLEDVARITKIQVRILERLESGTIKAGDGMPAEVFVRGFVRSIAKCVGLDQAEALRRYSEAAAQAALDVSPVTASPAARAFVESMSELAPTISTSVARTSAPRLLDSTPSHDAPSNDPIEPAITTAVETVGAPVIATAFEPATDVVVEAAATATAIEVVEVAAPTDGKKKKSKKGSNKSRGKRKDMATGTPFEPTPVVAQPVETAPATVAAAETTSVEMASRATASVGTTPIETPTIDTASVGTTPVEAASVETASAPIETLANAEPAIELEPGQTWSPRMPVTVAPTVPWRINASAQVARSKATTARIIPSLVIDDSDPDLAERELEDRAASRSSDSAVRRSFLPPILLDREDRAARQGGLTLAVIILLIAATLTLSYLMRRPSSSGDGVTQADLVESVDQTA